MFWIFLTTVVTLVVFVGILAYASDRRRDRRVRDKYRSYGDCGHTHVSSTDSSCDSSSSGGCD